MDGDVIGASVSVWTLIAFVWVAAGFGVVLGWALCAGVQNGRRGGMLDLTPARDDGSLGMDWADPRRGAGTLLLSDIDPATGRTYLDEWTRPWASAS